MSERGQIPTPDQKALAINLDKLKFGTVVEIGAGQETARLFFGAGAAAGTIAKTMSAYDMSVSDDICGKLVVDRLKRVRPPETTFFAYAATVTAKSYKHDNECHGWIGIRVQLKPGAEPCDVILHVRMLDDGNRLQSEALGVLGVNLIYGVFHYYDRPKTLIDSLSDFLGSDRIEIDLINLKGPEFRQVESRLMNLHLIRAWQTRAVMFDAAGNSVIPAEMLHHKSAMVIRGSFKPPTRVHVDMTESGLDQFLRHHNVDRDKVVVLAEITMSELVTEEHIADSDFLARVDLLSSLGYNVLISDYVRFFRLRSYLRRYTQDPIGLVLSVLDFDYLFNEQYYEGLEGGILEAMGKLFPDNTQVYVYPTRAGGELISLENIRVPDHLRYLLRHLVSNRLMIASDRYREEHLHISARCIAEQIPRGRGDWEQQLPDIVTRQILERKLFGLS